MDNKKLLFAFCFLLFAFCFLLFAFIFNPIQLCAANVDAAPIPTIIKKQKFDEVDNEIRENLQSGIEQTVFILFDDSEARGYSTQERRARGLHHNDEIILEETKRMFAETKKHVKASFNKNEIEILFEYDALPMVAVKIKDEHSLRRLLEHPEVIYVYKNGTYQTFLAESLPLINQPTAVSLGKIGQNTSVAVLDTGVNYTGAAFGNCTSPGVPSTCRVAFARDFAPEDNQLDDSGHGTNVAGIVAGVAPKTRIIALDVFNGMNAEFTFIADAINWVLNNRSTFNIVAINLSLGINGYGINRDCPENYLTSAIQSAWEAGITTVIAAGNDGFTNKISAPACAPYAVSVGSVTDTTDSVSSFSDFSANLDLLAPGEQIIAAGISMKGTSQAAPHVAGAIAILRSAKPLESANRSLNRLILTGTPVTDSRSGTNMTKPRLNVGTALTLTKNTRASVTISRWATQQGGFWDTQRWVSGDFNGDGKVDLAKAFDDGGGASIDVHLSNGSTFAIARWATQQGGFWNDQQWMSGDFNGDKKTDLAKVFNCGNGLACIDVHLSTGSGFNIVRWASNQGGFWNSQRWVAGDFNGDGKTDLAKVFDDGGLASIDVHLSTGNSFNIARWMTKVGGFWSSQKWIVGDFNGDKKADFANIFNENQLASIDVHVSNGNGNFTSSRWATGQGGFWDGQQWVAGDFNGDGVDDLAKVFYDVGLASIDASISNRNSFNLIRLETKSGGFWDKQKWITGDFNGDKRSDFANAYNDGGWATIDVHR